MGDAFSRTRYLIGEDGLDRLRKARVAVFGVGGVGSYVVEALCRTGVGSFLLVDNDVIGLSNLNRQMHATHDTIGQYKTKVMAQRILSINPQAVVETKEVFCLPDNVGTILQGPFDYIVDAVDTVSAKIGLVMEAYNRDIPIISCMGAGNKLDPTLFKVADIYDTSTCPLCRIMRRELRRCEIPALKVVYSTEQPMVPIYDRAPPDGYAGKQPPGSISFVPSVAGLIAAGEVTRSLLGEIQP